MPATDAQILANRANTAKSTGETTPEGKERSGGNALKHGPTAARALPEREAAEVERRTAAFVEELDPSGEVGLVLARHAARMSMRMERYASQENAALAEHVRKALAEFVPPEGVTDEAEIARLRKEAERRALFDASAEATLARKCEAAAERSFFRALKELRLHERALKAARAELLEDGLGSILPGAMTVEGFKALYAEAASLAARKPTSPAGSVDRSALRGRVDVPIEVGRRR